MSLYEFATIDSKEKFFEAVKYLDRESTELIKKVFGKNIAVAGNIALFSHSEIEYSFLKALTKDLIIISSNPRQKYFQLIDPIILGNNKYEWLYIRKPKVDSPQVGDIDFVLGDDEYNFLKNKVAGGGIKFARIYDRPNWDMIELFDPKSNVLPYITTKSMAEKVRLKD